MLDCVADAQAAVRWLRRHPCVDGTRVVAAGYSSGAHLAAAAALLPAVEPARTSCKPNALVLYAGVFDLGRTELSPLAHVRKNAPPGLVMYGVEDRLASQGQNFSKAMTRAGNRCEVAEFPGGRGTFAAHPDNPVFATALARVDEFLVSLGYLDAVTDVERRIADLDLSTPKPRRKRIAASP